jgi:hypothetical protein
MEEPRRRLLTRLLLLAMIASALWGGWLIAKNDGRRGRIGPPPKSKQTQDKESQSTNKQILKFKNLGMKPMISKPR